MSFFRIVVNGELQNLAKDQRERVEVQSLKLRKAVQHAAGPSLEKQRQEALDLAAAVGKRRAELVSNIRDLEVQAASPSPAPSAR